MTDFDFSDFRQLVRRMDALADANYAVPLVELGAEAWTGYSRRVVPVDTGQLQARIGITYVGGSAASAQAEVEADTPYAGYVEFGTRYQPAQPYWRDGRDYALDAVVAAGGWFEDEIRRVLVSGGSPNPRALVNQGVR